MPSPAQEETRVASTARQTELAPVLRNPPTPGRGRKEHKNLQLLIKRRAESMGWRAAVEDFISTKTGSVDVSLKKGSLSIACEVSITAPADYEVDKLKKCLAAGFTHVLSVSPDERQRAAIEQSAKARLQARQLERVRWLASEELFGFLQEQDARAAAILAAEDARLTRAGILPPSRVEPVNRQLGVAAAFGRSLAKQS